MEKMNCITTIATTTNFESLNDDTLLHILYFVGPNSFLSYGLINKRCNHIFDRFGLAPKTFTYGYAPESIITQRLISSSSSIDLFNTLRGIPKAIVSFNRNDLLRWAILHQHFQLLKNICDTSAGANRLDILKKIFQSSHDDITRNLRRETSLCMSASYAGNLDILRWLHEQNNQEWDEWSCSEAAYGGHLHCLQYLRANGCPWDTDTCCTAVTGGHLHILKFLKEQGCPWSPRALILARGGGNEEIIQWLREETFGFIR